MEIALGNLSLNCNEEKQFDFLKILIAGSPLPEQRSIIGFDGNDNSFKKVTNEWYTLNLETTKPIKSVWKFLREFGNQT